MGFHPETGEELQLVTREIVELWKAQNADTIMTRIRKAPQRIDDPERFGFFDAVTGKPRVWYWRGTNGEYEFYDNRGFHPRTGETLVVITREAIAVWKRDMDEIKKKETERSERAEHDRQNALEQERRKQEEQQRAQQAAAICDELAANPTDPRKPANVPGVRYDDLKTQAKAAVGACLLALQTYPEEPRYRYQYARALQVDEPEKALYVYKELVRNNYPASYDNAGWLLIRTRKDFQQAIGYFKDGVRRGDPDSAVSLADMIDRQYYMPENDPTATKFALLSWAAQRGHPGAQRALEQERIKNQQLQIQQQNQQQQEQLMMQALGAVIGTVLQNVGH